MVGSFSIIINCLKDIIFEGQQTVNKDFDILIAANAIRTTDDEGTESILVEATPEPSGRPI